MMQRYSALALDNIRRDPAGFLLASAYRVVRLFVIRGHVRSVYGAAVQREQPRLRGGHGRLDRVPRRSSAWRDRRLAARLSLIGLPLLLVAYIPATLAPVLTNMRYTVTVQPLMFIFVAIAIDALARWLRRARRHVAGILPPDDGGLSDQFLIAGTACAF